MTTSTARHTALEIPYAVYGTLRSGNGNAVLWDGLAKGGDLDLLTGYRLVTNGGFPYALPSESGTIVVEILRPDADRSAQMILRENLDRLEGYPSFYDRVLVDTDFGERCWLYTPAYPDDYAGLTPVPDNDWTRWTR